MATYYMWTGSGVTARANSTAYTAGARVVIALTDTSTNYLVVRRYVLECTTGGTSGAAVPAWSASYTPDTSTITDGTVTWTVRNPGYSSGSTVDWTFATIYFLYAVAAATASGDVILVHYASTDTQAGARTYTFQNNVNVISVDKDNSNAPTPMGTTYLIGNSGTAYNSILNGAYKVYIYGLTFRVASTVSNNEITIGNSDGAHFELENCYLWNDATGSSCYIELGMDGANSVGAYVRLVNCTIRLNRATSSVRITSMCDMEGVVYAATGTKSDQLFTLGNMTDSAGASLTAVGCDLSYCTTTLVGVGTGLPGEARFTQCKLGSNVTIRGTSSANNKSDGRVWVFDCSSGDTHGLFGYYDAFGSCVSDTGIYYTTGAAAQAWKIVTTANCSYYTPFVSPFVDLYNTGTSAITPRFEILRDGSTTAYKTDEVWGEFFVKSTSTSTQSTEYSDRMTLLGTAANQAAGAGTGSWTGEAASAWSGKVDSGSAVTPAENGHIRGRVCVGVASSTVYVDPQIRTA